jgi:cytochrome c
MIGHRYLSLPVVAAPDLESPMKLNRTALLVLSLTSALSATPVVNAAEPAGAASSPAGSPAGSVERGDTKRATALLDRAVDYLQKNGPEKSFGAFNDRKGTFVSDQYYVFTVGLDGILHASGGASRGLVGLNVLELHDASGKPFIRDMLALARTKESGTIDYHWLNQVDNRVENKTSQFRKVGDYLVCVGFYVPRASAEEAKAMLDKAVAFLKKSGNKIAYKAFNDPQGGYVINDEYVFAIDLDNGKYRASGASPSLTGVDVRAVSDAAGKPLFKDMIALAKLKNSGTVDYVWRNPATNAVEPKHSLIQRVGNVLLGVGYYTKN